MMTGMMLFMTRSGFNTPMDEMPTPDFAVPYAAPRSAPRAAGARGAAPPCRVSHGRGERQNARHARRAAWRAAHWQR